MNDPLLNETIVYHFKTFYIPRTRPLNILCAVWVTEWFRKWALDSEDLVGTLEIRPSRKPTDEEKRAMHGESCKKGHNDFELSDFSKADPTNAGSKKATWTKELE
ncbi:MAG: hypothetical protein U5N86_07950 [Planctomycetota bacterium]|nr:hypothetical protein [Planctomycetota bacterium]